MDLRKWKDRNAGALWFSLINIYDCRRKLNKANGVILNSLWSWLAELTTDSEARTRDLWEWCDFSFLHVTDPCSLLCETSNRESQNVTVIVSTYLLCTFSCLCDWLSKRIFFLFGGGAIMLQDISSGAIYNCCVGHF